MTVPVVIVDYDPRWPARYQEEQAQILGAIGHLVDAIEHVGSTSVPGLGAKPIIDIMVAVRSLADAPACIGPLERIGYEYVSEYEASIPERRYFRKRPVRRDTHHLHMVERESAFWERHILFRDHLRAHPEIAQEYDRLKRELAARFGADRDGYTDSKTSFIESVVAQARAGKAIGSHRA